MSESSATETETDTVRLHLGCGRDVRAGWINLDGRAGSGIDVVADLDDCANTPLPFEDGSVDEFLGSHLLEHLESPLPFMQELHRIARPGALATFNVPYGSSDDAWTDPTHRRPYFIDSFGYFSQPYYWRADYGYRGDWQPGLIMLEVEGRDFEGMSPEEVLGQVMTLRNVVTQMTVVMSAVKPVRAQDRALQEQPEIEFKLIGELLETHR